LTALISNIKLTIAYDGSNYLGWQKTSMGPSIEEALRSVLRQIFQHEIQLQAASRTDAGVHAFGQIVNFFTSKEKLDLHKLKISLNSLLPADIAVMQVERAEDIFHPTLDSIGKEYHYHLCYGSAQLPLHRHYSWHYPHKLDIVLMQEAARMLVGTHDFSAFCNFKKNSRYQDYLRDVQSINIIEMERERLRFEVSGNHFLYKMVRNIVGTLVYIGRGKIPIDALPGILTGNDRTKAGMTAPAHGLILHRVFYP
jgi:tRNA pseudouridine38-40 synthase